MSDREQSQLSESGPLTIPVAIGLDGTGPEAASLTIWLAVGDTDIGQVSLKKLVRDFYDRLDDVEYRNGLRLISASLKTLAAEIDAECLASEQ